MPSKSKKQTRMEEAYRFIRSTLSNCNADRKMHSNINIENQLSLNEMFGFVLDTESDFDLKSKTKSKILDTVLRYQKQTNGWHKVAETVGPLDM